MFPGVDQAAGFAANFYFQASPVACRIFPNLLGLAVELTGSMRDLTDPGFDFSVRLQSRAINRRGCRNSVTAYPVKAI